MAIAVTQLGSTLADTNPGTTLPIGSITPDGSAAVAVGFQASGVAGATNPTIDTPTWLSGAWEEFELPDTLDELNLNIGATVASPSADTVTLDFGADTLTGGGGIAAKITGADTSDLVVQSATATGTGGDLSAALGSALADANNAVLAIVGIEVNEAFSATDGETIVAQGGYASPTRRFAMVYKVGANDIQLDWTTSTDWAAILVEIKAAGGGGTHTDLTPSDTITLSDAAVKAVGKPVADTVTLSDSASKGVGKPAADTVSLSDAVVKGIGKFPADTISLSDQASRVWAARLTPADTITLGDATSRVWTALRSAADTVTLSDAVNKAVGKNPADSVTMSDAVAKALGKLANDTLTLTDAQAKFLGKVQADFLNLTDDQIILLNGLSPFVLVDRLRTMLGIGK